MVEAHRAELGDLAASARLLSHRAATDAPDPGDMARPVIHTANAKQPGQPGHPGPLGRTVGTFLIRVGHRLGGANVVSGGPLSAH
jgi:hypothetical protein